MCVVAPAGVGRAQWCVIRHVLMQPSWPVEMTVVSSTNAAVFVWQGMHP
jgi:hypothetical protein